MHPKRSPAERQPSIKEHQISQTQQQHELGPKHPKPKVEAQEPQQSAHRVQVRPQPTQQPRHNQPKQQSASRNPHHGRLPHRNINLRLAVQQAQLGLVRSAGLEERRQAKLQARAQQKAAAERPETQRTKLADQQPKLVDTKRRPRPQHSQILLQAHQRARTGRGRHIPHRLVQEAHQRNQRNVRHGQRGPPRRIVQPERCGLRAQGVFALVARAAANARSILGLFGHD